jgi:hypothetical protein
MPTHFNHQLFTRRKHHPAGPHPDIQFRDLARWNFFFRRVGVDGPMRFAEQRVEGAVGGAEVAGGAEVDERVDDGDFVFRHAHAGEVGEGHVVALQDFARLVGLAELDEDV